MNETTTKANQQTSTISRIDTSSWLSWSCYLATFSVAGALNPAAVTQLSTNILATGVLIGSVWLFLACVVMIQNHMRLSVLAHTFGEPKQLVTSGPFRYSRNPIYVAFLAPLAALGVISAPAALIGIATYIAIMTLTVVRREECFLENEFGADYDDYRADVPRWFRLLPGPAKQVPRRLASTSALGAPLFGGGRIFHRP